MTNTIYSAEYKTTMCGVPGRMHNRVLDTDTGLFRNQKFVSYGRAIDGYGKDAKLSVEIRFDDECGNKHQTFAITAEVRRPRENDVEACGCLHDDIAAVFPEFAPLIKWHLMNTDGPMYYIANTTYHASNRDCFGRAPGEPSAWHNVIRFTNFPITIQIGNRFAKFLQNSLDTKNPNYSVVAVTHTPDTTTNFSYSPNYTLDGFECKWHECPFKSLKEAQDVCAALNTQTWSIEIIPTAYSEGKPRELDAARRSAIWPEATDEQLCLPKEQLTELLVARLPALIAEFHRDMRIIGMLWEQRAEVQS